MAYRRLDIDGQIGAPGPPSRGPNQTIEGRPSTIRDMFRNGESMVQEKQSQLNRVDKTIDRHRTKKVRIRFDSIGQMSPAKFFGLG
jgi:hypothetical protein